MALSRINFNGNQTGVALIEFALVVPLLLLLVVGIVEFSFAFYHLNILNKSVEDGARYFSKPLIARNGNVGSLIDTRTSGNKTNIDATNNLIIYGKTNPNTSIDKPLLPKAANYNPLPVYYCAEQSVSNAICATTTQHIRVTAVYQHDFLLGNVINNFTALGISNPLPLTASVVMRVE